MNDEKAKPETTAPPDPEKPGCTCVTDPFANLPPELRPRNRSLTDGLRKVACPDCSLVFWTNRKTDLCAECEKKAARNSGG